MVSHNNYASDRLAQVFGIKVADQMTSVQARVLPPPVVPILQHSQPDGILFICFIRNDLFIFFYSAEIP